MVNIVNTAHDAGGYDQSCYQHEIYDANILYEALQKINKKNGKKEKNQKFTMLYLLYLGDIQKQLRNKTYQFSPTRSYIIKERGKTRLVHDETVGDRIVSHAICDNFIMPSIQKYMIYDNGAGIKGKGVAFARKRLICHLRRYYNENKTNDGYILLMDFTKYYDNIRHENLIEQFEKYINDDYALQLIRASIKRSEVDVSYMDDEEYASAMDAVYSSLEHEKIDKALLTEQKYLKKSLKLGDQIAHDGALLYPTVIDNYIKIVKGMKYAARSQDDSYVIHSDKKVLEELLKEVTIIANGIGITLNPKKTRICKLSSSWKFLKIYYSLTESGRIVQKIDKKALTKMRARMKRVCKKIDKKSFTDWFCSWFNGCKKYMSRQQKQNMKNLYLKIIKEGYSNA